MDGASVPANGVNIFGTFGTLLRTGIGLDFRAALGTATSSWAISLTLMFGTTVNLIGSLVMGLALVALQIKRGQIFAQPAPQTSA